MQTKILKQLLSTIFIASLSFGATSAIAAQDLIQQQLNHQFQESQKKLKEAESAKGEARQKLMREHMTMMHEAITEMKSMKPKAGMTAQEHEDWMVEHQKLMNQAMGQMMDEHHLLMSSSYKHKH
jgi:uncharacterized protein YicC (UPF0701 family)